MADDDLTTTPVQRSGWGAGGNYALTPRNKQGGQKPQLNPQPVGGDANQAAKKTAKKKSLDPQPVGKQPATPRKKEGGGLQLSPVGSGPQGGQGGNRGNDNKQGGTRAHSPHAPSAVNLNPVEAPTPNEWDEVNEEETTLHAPGGVSPTAPSNQEEEGWGEVDGDFTPGGEKVNTPTQGERVTPPASGEGDEGWDDLDGEFTPTGTPQGETPISPPRRKKGGSVYPPGFGNTSHPQEGNLLAPVSMPAQVSATGVQEVEDVLPPPVVEESEGWESVDDEFTPEVVNAPPAQKKVPPAGGKKKDTQQVKNRVKPLMGVSDKDDGWDDDNPAMSKDGIKDDAELKSFISASNNVRITERDIRIIRFLARYRYAQGIQVARYVGSSKRAIEQRLTKLGSAGLLRREDVTKGQSLWTPTGWGLSTADLDYTAIGAGKISYVTIAHTLGLVNLGIELEIAGENILEIPDDEFPRYRRFEGNELVAGETVITEREIRQAEARWKKAHARIDIERAFPQALQEWKALGNTEIASPELEVGNEAMLVIWATKSGRSDHVPDMVIAGERNADGYTNNIAIELELTAKSIKEWERVLGTYADARNLYGEVHYYTHKRTIADALRRVANDVGLREDEFFLHRYVPQQGNLPFWG